MLDACSLLYYRVFLNTSSAGTDTLGPNERSVHQRELHVRSKKVQDCVDWVLWDIGEGHSKQLTVELLVAAAALSVQSARHNAASSNSFTAITLPAAPALGTERPIVRMQVPIAFVVPEKRPPR